MDLNMNQLLRRGALRLLSLAALASVPLLAQAQAPASSAGSSWPNKPLRLVIPYPPGGLADAFARALAEGLGERLKQTVLVDNKPGGSLIIGTDLVAKSPPDGYTMLLGSVSSLGINAAAFKKLPYDPLKDFAPVSLVFRTPLFLMVAPSLPAGNVKELIAYGKAHPGTLSYASLGHGSSLHLSGELFKTLAGVDIVHVPYKGTTTAVPDLMTGRVSMMFDGGALLPQAREGKVKMMAVTSLKRLSTMPELPTMAESGVPGYEMDFWFGIVAPAGTPAPIVERLAREIAEVAMAEVMKQDLAFWSKLLREYKVEPQ
jgi:tripartite-type tricarboxylate transporter receptor subunit TctC